MKKAVTQSTVQTTAQGATQTTNGAHCAMSAGAEAPAGAADPAAIRQLADLFHLLGDPTRLAIVLHCRETLAVSELAARMDASVSLVSHHLRLLRAARIVKSSRSGKQVFYSLQDEHIRHTLGDMLAHVQETPAEDQEGAA